MRTVCYSVQRRRNSTHTREEARCAESRGRGTRSFTLLDPSRSTGRRVDSRVRVATRSRSYYAADGSLVRSRARALRSATLASFLGRAVSLGRGTRRRRCVGPGPAGAACPTPAREPQAAAGAGARGGAGGSAVRDSSRDSVRVGLELRTWDAGRAARDAQRDAADGSRDFPRYLLRGTGYRPVTGDSHRHIAYDPHSAQITRAARRSAALAHMPGLADGLSW